MRTGLPVHSRLDRGLTLGEMLVVLAVCSILAIMFFFSSSHAVIKTRISRVVSDQKSLAGAIQTYELDYSDVPNEVQGLNRLRGPGQYMTQIPLDPFSFQSEPQTYSYFPNVSPSHRWMIVSVGPDGVSDVQEAVDQLKKESGVKLSGSNSGRVLMSAGEVENFIARYSYDPTNGSTSRGDIILYGQ